jgi:hypothetical protein
MFVAGFLGVVVASIDESSSIKLSLLCDSLGIITVKREDREIYRWYHYLCLFFLVALAGLDFPEKKPTME